MSGNIVGIGGIFFKSPDHKALRAWYRDKLGLDHGPHGAMLQHQPGNMTVWSIFPGATEYFQPSDAPFMINYIVDDLDAFLAKCQANDVKIDPKRDDQDYGRFAWIYDPEGNKIELWQPLP